MKDAMTTIWETQPGPTPPLRDGDDDPYSPSPRSSPEVAPPRASRATDARPGVSPPTYADRAEPPYSAPTPPPPLPPPSSSPPTRRGGGRRAAFAIVGVTALVGAGFGAGYYATNHSTAPTTPALVAAPSTTTGNLNGGGPSAGERGGAAGSG